MNVCADMAGKITEICVTVGAQVLPEQELVIVESMKMQIPIVAPTGGTVKNILVTSGQFVNAGDILLELH